ncbi:MAG: DMT family transporter [Burkholderiales bacterium]|nr:DMT family transporter [Burkholderiales bacterium]
MSTSLTLARAPTPGSAIAMIVGAMACFTLSDALAKYLTGFLPVIVIVWIRYFAFVVVLSPLLRRGRTVLRTKHPWLHLLRALALACSAAFFILGLRALPLAEVTALAFASPLFVTVLSAWLLHERVDRVQWLVVTVGFAGVLVVMRPGTGAFQFAALFPLCSSLAWAIAVICTRKLTLHDGVDTTLLYSGLFGFALLSIAALPQFVVPPAAAIGAAVAMALVWSAAQWLSVHAYHRGDAAVLAPFSYTQLLWSTLIGIAVFRHVPDTATFAGIGTILVCGVVAAWWSTRDAAGPARPG